MRGWQFPVLSVPSVLFQQTWYFNPEFWQWLSAVWYRLFFVDMRLFSTFVCVRFVISFYLKQMHPRVMNPGSCWQVEFCGNLNVTGRVYGLKKDLVGWYKILVLWYIYIYIIIGSLWAKNENRLSHWERNCIHRINLPISEIDFFGW